MVAIAEPDSPQSSGASTEAGGEGEGQSSPQQPLDPLLLSLAQLTDFFHDYLEARKDQIGATVRKLVLIAAAVVTATVMAITILVESVVLLMSGLAELISARWKNYPGLGEVLIGGDLILFGSIIAIIGAVFWARSSRKRLKNKYERLHAEQRNRFGRDVSQH